MLWNDGFQISSKGILIVLLTYIEMLMVLKNA